MSRATDETAQAARDEQLAALLADLTQQLRQGQAPDMDRVGRDHPDLAAELRELWPALLLSEEMGKTTPPMAARDKAPPLPEHPPHSFGDYELLEELGRGGMGVVF